MKPLQLFVSEGSASSETLKRLADKLSERLGYKVYRTTKYNPHKRNLVYGFGIKKLDQYKFFEENTIPSVDYTTDKDLVKEWLAQGHTVFHREKQLASCGEAIKELTGTLPEEIEGGFFTKYRKKDKEFRVQMFEGTVVSVREKRRKSSFIGTPGSKIRSLSNGYVFCKTNVQVPDGLLELAQKAAKVSGSSFMGVDVGYNSVTKELFVFEVNSGPAIEGVSIDEYVEVIVNANS